MKKEDIEKRIKEIESLMALPDFWNEKVKAQSLIKELQDLKLQEEGVGPFDRCDAHMTIFAGAGGDDAEDFASMLLNMYLKYFQKNNWKTVLLHENKNNHGGYRNITLEVSGSKKDCVFGTLKHESGVHRLVRISPFNAKSQRHTSFAMVEFVPKFEKDEGNIKIPESDLKVEFAKSSGPGGQNVNKRETAVRILHIPTNISVHVTSERSQAQNREKALEILKGKLFALKEKEREAKESGMYISKITEAEWGSQIRSYIIHPYKLVKDHRTNVETSDVSGVLEEGNIDIFLKPFK